MASRLFRFAVLLVGTIGCAGPALARTDLHITTEYSPPYNMLLGGAVVGSGTDKVSEIMRRVGISYRIEFLPWPRAFAAALNKEQACVYSTTRTPERETRFKWVGPLNITDWVLFGRADHPFALRTLDDARALRLGTYSGDARDSYLRAHGYQVSVAQNDTLNPKKLLLGHIDLWATSTVKGRGILAQNGWSRQIVPLLTFNKVGLYLACNPALSDALVGQMNAALAAMDRDGTSKAIERRYEQWVGDKATMQ